MRWSLVEPGGGVRPRRPARLVPMVALAGFAAIALELIVLGGVWFDPGVSSWMSRIEHPMLTRAMRGVTVLGDGLAVGVLGTVVSVVCWRAGHRRAAVVMALSIAGAGLMSAGLKLAFFRERPDIGLRLVPASSYAFPSGHSMAAAACYGALAVTLRRVGRWRAGLVGVSLLCIALVGVSRVYLRVHYPSDVLAGWLLGLGWVVWLDGRYPSDPPAPAEAVAPAPPPALSFSSGVSSSESSGTRNEQESSSSGKPIKSHTDDASLLSCSSEPHSLSGVSRSAHSPAC